MRSSRGIVTLIHPVTDVAEGDRRKFPAFITLQFVVTGDEAAPKLDMVGLFRKHEMRWWWPVNVAEMQRLQADAIDRLRPKYPQLGPGRLITLSVIAKTGKTVPQVAIPLIDLM